MSAFRCPRIVVFSGSSRDGSINTKLAKAAAAVATRLGADTTILDIGSYNLPLYGQDDEAKNGLPQGAVDLKSKLAGADGWIVTSPEYNGFVPPLIVNAYTWCSRGDPAGQMYDTYSGKNAVIMSASPGALGGMRSINPHRDLLQNMGVTVLPTSVAVGGAFKAFDEETGELVSEKQQQMLESAVCSLFRVARDDANREATCKLVRSHMVGEYGTVNIAE